MNKDSRSKKSVMRCNFCYSDTGNILATKTQMHCLTVTLRFAVPLGGRFLVTRCCRAPCVTQPGSPGTGPVNVGADQHAW